MLIRYAMLAIACFASGVAISGGYFAFISMIGIFPKLLEKVKGARHYLLIECLLAYGAALANLIYVFKISVPVTWVGYTIICLFGGIFVGCLAGALTEGHFASIEHSVDKLVDKSSFPFCQLCH